MAQSQPVETDEGTVPTSVQIFVRNRLLEFAGLGFLAVILLLSITLATWHVSDPSWNNAVNTKPENWLGYPGAIVSDQLFQNFGLSVLLAVAIAIYWAVSLMSHQITQKPFKRGAFYFTAITLFSATLSLFPTPLSWALGSGLGGAIGDSISGLIIAIFQIGLKGVLAPVLAFILLGVATALSVRGATGVMNAQLLKISHPFNGRVNDSLSTMSGRVFHILLSLKSRLKTQKPQPERLNQEQPTHIAPAEKFKKASSNRTLRTAVKKFATHLKRSSDTPTSDRRDRIEPQLTPATTNSPEIDTLQAWAETPATDTPYAEPEALSLQSKRVQAPAKPIKQGKKVRLDSQPGLPLSDKQTYQLPPLTLLTEPPATNGDHTQNADALEQNARMLEGVLEDFGVRGEIIHVRPGPVVTLYELEPAPGIKSSRVIGLADDIARSMSAISARVAVVPGRNVIGIELPNSNRETVYLRELAASQAFEKSKMHLALALGKDIGGEPVLADLARMPHLLIAGTTGSGKSVGINTMIMSILYRMPPEQCRMIMIDPKMLELSIYEGIPHLLAPVVTDPKKAVVSLKWAVREMEDRYRKMSKMGVRNVDGYNKRARQALKKGEMMTRTVQTGYDPETREPIFEEEQLDLSPLPFIVVIIDEMADLMLVAGKEIEGAVQRLAQMARAAGIHVIMATQRPSVDVITGTIKANFPTRISFQVTSKIDSRTILGEQGAENLLGQGDMLYMAGGGRISRLHSPFVSDGEVEEIVNHLKQQAAPEYIDAITEEPADDPYVFPGMENSETNSGDDLYDKAVAVVLRDKKVSTSYIQRRLSIGYNRAATLIERMEEEGLISSPSQSGKREILVGDSDQVSH